MSEPTEAYFEALKRTQQHHKNKEGKTFSGAFLFKDQRKRVAELIKRYDAKTLLDYGCGYGKQYTMRDDDGRSLIDIFGLAPTLYDPGVPRYAADPVGKFDIVVCIQVLGCIPTVDLPWVIDRMYGFATKALFVAERIGHPHKATFDDMKDQMPHGVSAEEWLEHLRRPGSPVRLFLATRNKPAGIGWTVAEPGDQGT